ncbi:alcohol dehydrogenase catalytic domain-containing protein [Pseudoclavibacter sp. 13-3]|uniref:alcohol dehydrogenase catalytic domain-containing protein n=1 Tax=Pseudoclavibacter sp. 13-3 TaxID=2901228 RepID=UPI001E4E331C|nr:alcohol dehydrogenase catalytic domain-containing protein [Pseudoclavibacter sp. 13-3]MCD7100753.1 alcohol dehydrogenase catalytic domain-containing protein [Pseudoclavibacter sp. 13-3]
MKIKGAVLEEIGRPGPYAETRPITISELELDEPGPGELLVKIEAAGLCHSDLSVVNGNRPRPVPMLLGHESAGRIVEVGAGVTDVERGQRVVMTFLPRCGECEGCATDGKLPCVVGTETNNAGELLGHEMRLHRDGRPVFHHLGVSGFATYAVVNRKSVVPIEDDVPPAIAAVLGCAVLTGGGAVINAGKPKPGDDVIVVGLGGVGVAALLTALSLGNGKVIGVDALPAKLEQASSFGADEVYTPDEAIEKGIKAPVVIEAAGHPRAFETAVRLTGVGGITVTVGLPAPGALAEIEPLGITGEARTITGSYLGSAVPARDIPKYAQLWREGRLPLEHLISSHKPLSQINEAMDELASGRAIRQIIDFPDA